MRINTQCQSSDDSSNWIDMIESDMVEENNEESTADNGVFINLLQNPERFTGHLRSLLKLFIFFSFLLLLLRNG